MATKTDNTLTQAEINHSLRRDILSCGTASRGNWQRSGGEFAYKRLGCTPDSSLQDALASGLLQPRMHLPSMNRVPIKAVAPRAWRAICELLGGEARIGTRNRRGVMGLSSTSRSVRMRRGSRLLRKSAAGIRTAISSAIFWIARNKGS